MMPDYSLDTLSIHAGEQADATAGALSPPIPPSVAYKLPGLGRELFETLLMDSPDGNFAYSRWDQPTTRVLEEKVAALEGGEAALATASGMAAISALLFTFLKNGDHVVASEVCYAAAMELFGEHLPVRGIEATTVDTSDPDAVREAIQCNTRLLYVETPANPILRLSDIGLMAEIARDAGIMLAIDSTWAGPCLQRPLELGADYVIHSATKYLNGHGDALGGVIVGSRDGIHRIRKEALVHLGGVMSPFNAWLIARGMSTLPLRMARHSESALEVATFLQGHPAVKRVVYPGLSSHPQHELAGRQMSAGGGMISIQLKRGIEAAISLAEKARLFTYATSLGHARSLWFYYPSDMYVDGVSYLSNMQKTRFREWMGDGVVRLSVGLESPRDLIADLDKALNARTIKGKGCRKHMICFDVWRRRLLN
jgi:cystathionine beta-lyase/cystathionine gamma-synthase